MHSLMNAMKTLTKTLVLLTVLIVIAGNSAVVQAAGQPTLPQIELIINDQTLVTEVAITPEQRFHGLSFRERLSADAAMLFVYSREQPLYFTMQDAGIPLSIAYLSKDMVINEILDMEPFTRGPYPSAKPAMYALEVNQGWFERHNIKPGDRVEYK